jgi:enoyl-CoA hydratase/carnithine racemase
MINPEFVKKHRKESKRRDCNKDEAWDDVNYVDLEVDDDFIQKCLAIKAGEDYENTVSVPLDLPDDLLLEAAMNAHRQNITLNEYINNALRDLVDEFKQDPEEIFELWRRRKRSRKVNQLFRNLPEVSKPVIAAVEGFALGGGFELALLCDFIVAGEGAKFGLPETKIGLMPGGAGTQTLSRIVGKPLAKELIWTGRRLSAAEALSYRIVNHVTPTGEAIVKSREIAQEIANNAPLSVMFCKQAIERGFEVSLTEGMMVEADSFFALAFSKDKEEGLAAFREKRVPKFKGF